MSDISRKEIVTAAVYGIVGFIAMLLVLMAFASLASIVIQDHTSGTDVKSYYSRTDTATQNHKIIAHDVPFLDETYNRNWGPQPNGESGQTVNSTIWIADAKGGWQNQVGYSTNGAGYKQSQAARQIKGDFAASMDSIVTDTGVPEMTNQILMQGFGDYTGRVVNLFTGRPMTEYEKDMYGNMTLDLFIQLKMLRNIVTEGDWLEGCESSRLNASENGGFYVQPTGWTIDEHGQPQLNSSEWFMNETSKRFELIPGAV